MAFLPCFYVLLRKGDRDKEYETAINIHRHSYTLELLKLSELYLHSSFTFMTSGQKDDSHFVSRKIQYSCSEKYSMIRLYACYFFLHDASIYRLLTPKSHSGRLAWLKVRWRNNHIVTVQFVFTYIFVSSKSLNIFFTGIFTFFHYVFDFNLSYRGVV